MQGSFQVAQATGTGNSSTNSAPVRVYKLTKPLTDQAVVVNLGYDQKAKVDFSSIANEKITLVHIGEKLIILFDNQSTVTVEPFFDSRADGITIEMAPGRDVSVQEFASLFPIGTDGSVLPAADNGGNSNGNAQASGANFSPFAVDPLDPVPTNVLAGPEGLPGSNDTGPTGTTLPQGSTPAKPTISLGVAPDLAVDESFLTVATNGIAGSGLGPAGATVATGLMPFTITAPGGEKSVAFALSISAQGVDSGLIDSQTGNHVFLFQENGQIVGREGGQNGLADFTISVDATGHITLTDLRSMHEGTGEVGGDINEGVHLPAGMVTLTATVTDVFNQTGTATADVGPHLTFLDDGPAISLSGTASSLNTFEAYLSAATNAGINGSTPDASPTQGHALDTESFAHAFTIVTGADGATTAYALGIAANGTATNLIDSASGLGVVLDQSGNTISGYVAGHEGQAAWLVFTLSVNTATGDVTLTQDRAVHENIASSPDTGEGISLTGGLVTLTATVTDNDGDSASQKLDLSTHVTFHDDGPSISLSGTVGSLNTFEAYLSAATNAGVNGSTPDAVPTQGHALDTESFAGAFTVVTGADNATTAYTLSIAGNGTATNLIDSNSGLGVVLDQTGNTISGYVTGHEGDAAWLVFTLTVNTATGDVTLTQDRAVHENTASSPDTGEGIGLNEGLVTLTATVTDKDGDSAAQKLDLSSHVTFHDDGPSIALTGKIGSLNTFEAYLSAATNAGVDGSTPDAVPTQGHALDTESFAGAFTVVTGADNATTAYALSIAANGTATNLIDSASGLAVVLDQSGNTVSGYVTGHEGDAAWLVFTLAVNTATGDVTLTQDRAVHELTASSPDTGEGVSLTGGLVTLTATVTDNDGDSASQKLDLSSHVTFHDDGPSITLSGNVNSLNTFEAYLSAATNAGVDGSTPDAVPTQGHALDTESFAGAFTVVTGADGATTAYTLSIAGNGTATNLIDSASGLGVVLDQTGNTVSGYVTGHEGDAAWLVFTLAVNTATGDVTLTQDRAVHELTASSPDTGEGISLTGGLVTLTATVTDKDGDSAAQNLDLSSHVTFHDDGPSITLSGNVNSLNTFEAYLSAATNAGIDGSTPDAVPTQGHALDTESFAGAFTVVTGADNATTAYTLSIAGNGTATNLIDSASGLGVVLDQTGNTISGYVTGHEGDAAWLVFTLAVNTATGDVTLTQDRAVHELTASSPDTAEGISLSNGLVTLTATVTDKDGDSAAQNLDLSSHVTFHDDGPSVTLSGNVNSLNTFEAYLSAATNAGINGSTPDAVPTQGHALDTESFAGAFTVVTGADNATTAYALSISANGVPTNLIDSASGLAVVLDQTGNTISGYVTGHENDAAWLVFTLSVNTATGDVTLTQDRAVHELTASSPDTGEGISLTGGLVTLTATVTDKDGDSAAQNLDLSSHVTFHDDGPSIGLSGRVGSLNTFEAYLSASTNAGINGSTPDAVPTQGHALDTESFAGAFTVVTGADNATTAYALSISANGVPTNLIDSASGLAVVLDQTGNTISGYVTGHENDAAWLVFTLSVNTATGDVTLTQDRAVHELTASSPDTGEGISLTGGLVTLTATVTDKDGDSAAQNLDLSSHVTFHDDGPSISLSGNVNSLNTYEAYLSAATNAGINGSTPDAVPTQGHALDTESFAGAFTVVTGADNATTAYALSISANGVPTNLIDSASGLAVVLDQTGNTISGYVTGHENDAAWLVFTLSVNTATGDVTLTQDRAVHELTASSPDTGEGISLTGGLVTLTATVTDKDGDSAAQNLDLSSHVTFHDDGPSISLSGNVNSLNTYEAYLSAATNAGINGSTPDAVPTQGHALDTESFAGAFTVVTGADNATTAYALSIAANGTPTNLIDSASGLAVVLDQTGNTISGYVTGHEGDAAWLVFTLAVNTATGDVTLTQDRAVHELTASSPDTGEGISLTGGLVTLTATVTDKDGDSAAQKLDLSSHVTFHDDGPSISLSGNVNSLNTFEAYLSAATNAGINGSTPDAVPTQGHTLDKESFAGAFTVVTGADNATTAYALSISANGTPTNLIDSASGLAVVLDQTGNTISGYVTGHENDAAWLVFTLAVNTATGDVTLTQDRAVHELTASSPDTGEGISLTGGLVTLTATVTDKDGDSAAQNLDLSSHVTFHDDGPSISLSGRVGSLNTFEAYLSASTNAGVNGSTPDAVPTQGHTLDKESFAGAFTVVTGADNATTAYALSIAANGTPTNLIDSASGLAVVLDQSGNTVSGYVTGHDNDAAWLVFTLTVNTATGDVTLTQDRAVHELTASSPDTGEGISLTGGLVTLTATVTDKDGDSASQNLDLSTHVTFHDDGPSISLSGNVNSLNTFEAYLSASTNAGVNGSTPDAVPTQGHALDKESFAGAFTVVTGADNATTAYALSISGNGVATNLIDSASGLAVVLDQSGNTVSGYVTGHEGDAAWLVFTLAVNTATGDVTLTQDRAVHELTASSPDTGEGISLTGGLVTLTATVTDKDGDSAAQNLDLSTHVTFHDDGPSISLSGNVNSLNTFEAYLSAATNAGINGSTPDAVPTQGHALDTESFAGAFSVVTGADGATTAYTLGISGNGVATNLIDSASGLGVVLDQTGNTVSGYVAGHEGQAAWLVFTLTVNTATGSVTLTQDRAVHELTASSPDTGEGISLTGGLVTLTATVTDKDGDSAAQNLDLSTHVTFHDDGPSISLSGNVNSLNTFEAYLSAATNAGINGSTPDAVPTQGHALDTESFAGAFTVVTGADGAITAYTLGISGNGVATNLIDSASGLGVVLDQTGNTISGYVAGHENQAAWLVFTLSVNTATGSVTLTQDRAVHENTASSPDTGEGISLTGGLVTLTATVTDKDGDSAAQNLDLSSHITFHDDGPSIKLSGTVASLNTYEAYLSAATNAGINGSTPDAAPTQGHTLDKESFAGAFTVVTGADGATTAYALSIANNGIATNLIDSASGLGVVLDQTGNTVSGYVAGHDNQAAWLVFTLAVDPATGNVTLTQDRAVHENTASSPDTGEGISLTGGLVTLTATVTDKDGDSASQNLDLSTHVTFHDDGPSWTSAEHGVLANQAGFSVTGDLQYITGADGLASLYFTGVSLDPLHPTATTIQAGGFAVSEYVDASGVLHGVANGADVFTVTLNSATSTYSFDLLHTLDAYTSLSVNPANLGGSGPVVYATLADTTGNPVTNLTGYHTTGLFNVNSWLNETHDTLTSLQVTQDFVNASASGEGVSSNNFNTGDFMRFDFGAVGDNSNLDHWTYGAAPGAVSVATGNQITFTVNPIGGTAIIDYVVHSLDGTVTHGVYDSSVNGTTLTANGHGNIDYVELYELSGKSKILLSGITELVNNGQTDVPFTVGVKDGDGDTTSGSFDVNVNGATTLTGTAGNDVIVAGASAETLTGNGGNDKFVLNLSAHFTISDFNSGDLVLLDVPGLSLPAGTSNPLPANQFTSSAATGADQNAASAWNESASTNKFFFNNTTHELWYSANGTGSDKVDLAHLSTGVPAAANIHIY
ncbi:hypothetical protein FBZ93_118118 [Bradyrhizobium macuxiense]|uniref:DUF5801 domain-containing protein n=1 Tax=Bradyrhizobium macuxiense TaxID=1755647 RepID=A0A560KYV3_9BRAD|nr:DUF5801 repeats-in-toxin domain-containing protein [Bradyrhizobium macuxiense]TWB88438.1 hypothetical protein FBZ93_118118 [Bradyrhizobium macuxiense]